MKFLPLLFPLAVFLLTILIPIIGVVLFLRKVRVTMFDTKVGQKVRLDTPLGALDIRPREGNDPELEGIMKYPGAVPVDPLGNGYEMKFGSRGTFTAEVYWTHDPVATVWEYYRRELPNWAEDRVYENGFRLCEMGSLNRTITINSGHGRTEIEYSVLRRANDGKQSASAAEFGMLR
jgi:hypothetical protein